MDPTALQISYALDSVAKVLAEWTVARQLEVDPVVFESDDEDARGRWVSDVQVRLAYLAQAVAVRRPELFVAAVSDSRTWFTTHGLSPDQLRISLECLREVLEQRLPAEAANAAVACVDRALAAPDPSPEPPPIVRADTPHGRLAASYLEALLDGRAADARRLVLAAAADGSPVAEIYEHVLQPAQAELGRMWQLNEITVADEHYATGSTQAIMAQLRLYFPEVATTDHCLVATAVGGDIHDIGVRMVSDFFEMAGWRTFFLGANTPPGDVIEVAGIRRADVLAISAGTSLHVRGVGELIAAARSDSETASAKVIVGGGPFNLVPDLWEELGADGSVSRAADAPALAARLLGSA